MYQKGAGRISSSAGSFRRVCVKCCARVLGTKKICEGIEGISDKLELKKNLEVSD